MGARELESGVCEAGTYTAYTYIVRTPPPSPHPVSIIFLRYPLFFRELTRALTKQGADEAALAALAEASKASSAIAEEINNKSRRTENNAKMVSVVGRMEDHPDPDTLIQPHRELVFGMNCTM